MDHVFFPKNYSEALYFFIYVPFYSFSDFYNKSPLIFKAEEVKHIESHNGAYGLCYSRKDYEGRLSLKSGIDLRKYENIEIKEINRTAKDEFKILFDLLFNRYSPSLWQILITVFISIVFFNLLKSGVLLPSHAKPELYTTAYCGIDCIKASTDYLLILYLDATTAFLGLLLSCYFLFYKSKKLRRADIIASAQTTAFLLLLVHFVVGVKAIHKLQDPKFLTINRIIYHQEYFKVSSERAIASEIETLDF